MIVLIAIGFLGGLVTGISPCIVPVIPVVFAAGAVTGQPDEEDTPPVDRRRPFMVVGGLVVSFSVFTLIGSSLLSLLGLPQDFLRNVGLVVLAVVALGLIFPAIGDMLERPFVKLAGGRQHNERGGFILGLSLGLLFVPCAGPVLAAITVVSANHHIGLSSIILTVSFALGVSVPLLIFAITGQRLAGRMRVIRTRAVVVRKVVGAVLLLTALVIGLNLTAGLQRALPGYTDALQKHIEGNAAAKKALAGVTGASGGTVLAQCSDAAPTLANCGTAPALTGIDKWLNTPGGTPLSLGGLRGRVVLVDFWTYSCINCQRTLPHLEAWNRAYASAGLTIVGVHTPEFDFEHVVSNVSQQATQLGVQYPIAIDNEYATWNAYQNHFWPAEYLIDATGVVRHVDFGEGHYGQSEAFIRQLLTAANPGVILPDATDVPDATPTTQSTPESYLGYQHPQNVAGESVVDDQLTTYSPPPDVPLNAYAYGGGWTVGPERSTAGAGASLLLHYQARDVYLVLGGSGTVEVSVNGAVTKRITVANAPTLYTLTSAASSRDAMLSLQLSSGVSAYDFTFG